MGNRNARVADDIDEYLRQQQDGLPFLVYVRFTERRPGVQLAYLSGSSSGDEVPAYIYCSEYPKIGRRYLIEVEKYRVQRGLDGLIVRIETWSPV